MTKHANISDALAAAQAEFPAILKNREAKIVTGKGTYIYAYADLNDVLAAVRPVLNKHGMSLTQRTIMGEHGLIIRTELHFGETTFDSEWPLALQQRPQETGANLSYYRRYALTSLLGIAAEETTDETAEGESDKAVKKANFKPHTGAIPTIGKLSMTDLQNGMRELASHIEGASDEDELAGILHDHQEIMEQCMKDKPGWWYGDDRNKDFESMEDRIARRRQELQGDSHGVS